VSTYDRPVDDCLACQVNAGIVSAPGGVVAETEHWRADHCIGPFGVGAVVVKTKSHVEDFWALEPAAAEELGPFLREISGAIVGALGAERVYMTLWVDKPPHHVHLVVYPRYPGEERRALDLQLALRDGGPPAPAEAEKAANALCEFIASERRQ
jgi:diadenosine tetraphosphate (Ap4A) HIT family hydrolase